MTDLERKKIEEIIRERKVSHAFYTKHSPVYNSFINFEQEAYKSGTLERRHKELIAIGISIVLNCESCMEWHIKSALENGAESEQIIEAIGVGMEMGGGPATVSARFARLVLEYYNKG